MEYPEIKERAEQENAEILWADETGVDNCEIVERGFAPKGHPPVLPVETKRVRVNMVSAISQEGSLRYMIYRDSMNQQKLIEFMSRLIAKSQRKVFLIMDNLRVHHGKLVSAWLERHKSRIEVFFLPPYAPECNPDEYLNHGLKLSVHSGELPFTADDIVHKMRSYLSSLQHNPQRLLRFFFHSDVSYCSVAK